MSLEKECQFDWDDGWGHGHACHMPDGHAGDHRCRCDQTISKWMAESIAVPELFESPEEQRIRLREELRAQQAAQ